MPSEEWNVEGEGDREAYKKYCNEILNQKDSGSGGIPRAGKGKGKARGSAGVPRATEREHIPPYEFPHYVTVAEFNAAMGAAPFAIRAVQGHTVPIDYMRLYTRISLDMLDKIPRLVQGTQWAIIMSIMWEGLLPRGTNMIPCTCFAFEDGRAFPTVCPEHI